MSMGMMFLVGMWCGFLGGFVACSLFTIGRE